MEDNLYSISSLAKKYNISTRTIRYYEELGLLNPIRDNNTHHRVYTKSDRARLKLILRGKRFGFPLDEIKEMIELFDIDKTGVKQIKRTIEYGDRKLLELDDRINELCELKEEILNVKMELLKKLEENN